MRPLRVLGLALAVCLPLLVARPAEACGVWRMTDVGKGRVITWLINSGSIARGARKVGALYLDEHPGGARVVAKKKVLFDVKDGALRRRGKVVGQIVATPEGGQVTLGKRVFAVALTDAHALHDMPAWRLRVTRDGADVITADDATALCAAGIAAQSGQPADLAAAQAEIVRRVAYYLAWRELGA